MSSNRRSSLRLSASQPTLRSCSFQGPPFWARSYPASPENHETKHHSFGGAAPCGLQYLGYTQRPPGEPFPRGLLHDLLWAISMFLVSTYMRYRHSHIIISFISISYIYKIYFI